MVVYHKNKEIAVGKEALMKYCVNARIVSNSKIKSDYYKIILVSKKISEISKPGQFILIKVNNTLNPLIRRPFSINKIEKSNIHIIYKIVGKGTQELSKKREGNYLNIIGPLGNGIDVSASFLPSFTSHLILVGGGYGISPLVFLAEELVKHKVSSSNISVFIGAKSKDDILCVDDFLKIGIRPKIATEDGSKGFKGMITDLLILNPSLFALHPLTIYACGPHLMLKKVVEISKKFKTKCYVLCEEIITCGVGSCLGCAVKVKDKNNYAYKMVCSDGPVFSCDEIIFD